MGVRKSRYLLFLCLAMLLLGVRQTQAQGATLRGFVTDASNGQTLEGASVVLRSRDGRLRGTATRRDGLYLIPQLEPGRYTLRISFIGYRAYLDTLDLAPGGISTRSVALDPDEATLDEVLVQTERMDGAARITAGQQTVHPRDIELVPTPDVAGDLASYLTTLPGVVATGDQGGQLFIRGGEPAQNLVLLDGMTLYQPFHVLGFYSAFPSDILRRIDVYAGGYPSKFGGRISSVLDVWTRNGNNRRVAGAASLSPFLAAARLEGPLVKDRVSLLASVRRSMVEPWAEHLIDRPLPFAFADAFAKLNADVSASSRLSIRAVQTYDRGTLREDTGGAPPEEVRWQNRAVGARYLLLPRVLPVAADLRLTASHFDTELGSPEVPERTSSVRDIQLAMEWTFFGDRINTDIGMTMRHIRLSSELGGLFQNVEVNDETLTPFAIYIAQEIELGGGLRVRPGLRMQVYEVRPTPFLEPRLRVVWARQGHQVSGAVGLYHQELVGLTDRRDAASVFTAWSSAPRRAIDRIGPRAFRPDSTGTLRLTDLIAASLIRPGQELRALHVILGYRTNPLPGLDVAVEGFYKRLTNLLVAEWTPFPRFTTTLQPATGRAFGFDARLELRRGTFYGYVGYGYSNTRYKAEQPSLEIWFGTDRLSFRPSHDRRHQLNALLNVSLFGFDLGTRWAFGSGLPFTQAVAFDGYALVESVGDVSQQPGQRRVIYDRPFGAVLPAYHRLDVSLARTFRVGRVSVAAQASVINAYDRRNLFYLDVFTLRRVDQLPWVPSLGLEVSFE